MAEVPGSGYPQHEREQIEVERRMRFRAENTNDILFIASQQTGFGYFVNYGKTRRQGAEISLSGDYRWL